jgi:FlaG/FlaF family flagellin (archaellin)
MKKTWKARDEEGISALIGLVLLVGISMVLAMVLYTMVLTPPIADRFAPAGTLAFEVTGPSSVNITFGTFSQNPKPIDIKLIITNNSDTTDSHELWFTSVPNASSVNMNTTGDVSATYTDLNYMGNTINAGDYIIVDGLGAHTTYSVMVFHYPSDSLCQLAGVTTFTLE